MSGKRHLKGTCAGPAPTTSSTALLTHAYGESRLPKKLLPSEARCRQLKLILRVIFFPVAFHQKRKLIIGAIDSQE